jgi:hypothetical protein
MAKASWSCANAPGQRSVSDLEAIESREPREFAALKQDVTSLRREVARHSAVYDTRSWRMTAPLRAASGLIRTRLAQRRTG